MKKLLLQLDSNEHPSVFDTITAYDAGADHVLALGDVDVKDVRDLVYGAMFTRGGEDLKNTAIFIGGSDVPTGEAMLKEVLNTFFGPVRVSVMADPNGSNTPPPRRVVLAGCRLHRRDLRHGCAAVGRPGEWRREERAHRCQSGSDAGGPRRSGGRPVLGWPQRLRHQPRPVLSSW